MAATSPQFRPVAELISPPVDAFRSRPVSVTRKVARWYFGGVASTLAVCITHPLDTLKVYLQTQQGSSARLLPVATQIIRQQGFLALYSGISASLIRQLTHTTTRFGIYEALKPSDPTKPFPFHIKILTAGFSGACGGFVGAPADLVNVRMQNDVKLPEGMRRNYKHALDGLVRVVREEGFVRLWSGSSMVIVRSVFITIGQLSFYDQVKQFLLRMGCPDSAGTHLLGSSVAACSSTTITAPFDCIKTRMQNAEPGRYENLRQCIKETAKDGPLAFYKGFVPAFVRIGPQTVLMFLLYEQLRLNFGVTVRCSVECSP
ncbi:Mitochondrial dicarboxylate carrier [Hypsibius exemplaris]|uniref:Mitochondrial dicarboxylate carrier n=1 Tax=Hypsibius exemplaris TaxID=2072580 RepID=A0A1W0X348_HYPEX|nr:Mitochondrial dicarboxylate carrier [Hypsibius exemplaris]